VFPTLLPEYPESEVAESMERFAKLAIVAALAMSFWTVLAIGRQPQAQNPQPQTPDQSQQPAEKPPHTDAEPHPSARNLEHEIMDALKQDPHMTYSRVSVRVTDTEVLLTGVVVTTTAKDQAEQIATEHAGGRKVVNHIKVNPNTHPAPGI